MENNDRDEFQEDEHEAPEIRCGQCDRGIRLGEDAHELEQGVIGPRGFVPIAATTLLCSEACVRGFVSGTNEQIERRPRQIP